MLATDWGPPSSAALRRLPNPTTAQFWDKARLISHRLGERDDSSIVWDHIALYAPGQVWDATPPASLYAGGPVVNVVDAVRTALLKTLPAN